MGDVEATVVDSEEETEVEEDVAEIVEAVEAPVVVACAVAPRSLSQLIVFLVCSSLRELRTPF